MTDTPNLGLPFIEAAQAQKHVPHNEALRVLDTLVQLSVEASNLTSPPPKSPAQAAWVNWDNSTTQLNVANAADIVGWSAGDTVQLGDPNPSGTNVLGMIAIDISNYMQNNFGAVFRQKGLLLATYVSGTGGDVACDFSGTGASGSATGGNSLSNGARNQANFTIVTPTQSPVSNSNLLFVRESLGVGTALATTFARLIGFYV